MPFARNTCQSKSIQHTPRGFFMNIPFSLLIACIISFSSLISACSSEQENKEKGVIEQGTERVAQEAVQAIKTPLDLAKSAAEQQDAHNKQMTEQAPKP